MKNIMHDNEDFLPFIVITTSIALMNFGVIFFGAFSTMGLVLSAFVHIFVNFKLKHLKYVPVVKIIKYSIFCLLWNSITYFIAVYFKINILTATLNLTVDNLMQVGWKLAIMCVMCLGIFTRFEKQTNNNYERYAPQLIIIIFLIGNALMFVLTKNAFDMAIGIIIVVPYLWYVFNLLYKWKCLTIDTSRTSDV